MSLSLVLLRRLVASAATVLVAGFLAMAALTSAPGDAAEALLGEGASVEQLDALRRDLRLDVPLHQRYAEYVGGALARGDLGRSLASGRPVRDLVLERLPATALLAGSALLLTAAGGLGLGMLAAARPGGWGDRLLVGTTTLWLAIPPYWVALLLVLLLGVRLRWLPVYGMGTAAHLILPAVTLALPGIAAVARMVRAAAIDVARGDFVRTAHAKGLPLRTVLWRHVLPNSIVPGLTLLGLQLSHLLGGAFVVETIFAWPGLGRLTVQAVFERDLAVVLGAVLVVTPLALLCGLAVDLAHGAIDPRVRQRAL